MSGGPLCSGMANLARLTTLARSSAVLVGENADGRSCWMMRRMETSAVSDMWGNFIAWRPESETIQIAFNVVNEFSVSNGCNLGFN